MRKRENAFLQSFLIRKMERQTFSSSFDVWMSKERRIKKVFSHFSVAVDIVNGLSADIGHLSSDSFLLYIVSLLPVFVDDTRTIFTSLKFYERIKWGREKCFSLNSILD